jgi:hypothetical protein
MPREQFLKWLTHANISPEYKNYLFELAERFPIPLFFTFAPSVTAPDFSRSGFLTKTAGVFASKKKRFFVLEGPTLFYYKDRSKSALVGEIELIETVSEIKKAAKKDPPHLSIRRWDKKVFGQKVSKGQKKKGHHTSFSLFAPDPETLYGWVMACNTAALVARLVQQYGIPT